MEKPSLKRLVIGTNRLNGTTANLNSFTGIYNSALTNASDLNVDQDLSVRTLVRKLLILIQGQLKSNVIIKDFYSYHSRR